MNGYEKHSNDYGGPPVGWGTQLIVAAVVVAVLVVLGRMLVGLFLR